MLQGLVIRRTPSWHFPNLKVRLKLRDVGGVLSLENAMSRHPQRVAHRFVYLSGSPTNIPKDATMTDFKGDFQGSCSLADLAVEGWSLAVSHSATTFRGDCAFDQHRKFLEYDSKLGIWLTEQLQEISRQRGPPPEHPMYSWHQSSVSGSHVTGKFAA